jgi:ribosomal protein S18 acetylase RimI-like enzyme
MVDVVVESWSPHRAHETAQRIHRVYQAVFGDAPDEETWRDDSFFVHCDRRGFRFVAATRESELIGFAYGYVGERGQWWTDRVAQALPAEVAVEWVGGHFELVEIAVLEPYRGRGLGGRLHDLLLSGATTRRALLGTDVVDGPALRLYRSRGWQTLGRFGPRMQVMGRLLDASQDP